MENDAEYLTVAELAKEWGLGESTVWLMVKRSDVTRYRIPGQGKRTFIKRSDLAKLREPIPVGVEHTKKAAA